MSFCVQMRPQNDNVVNAGQNVLPDFPTTQGTRGFN